jgi:hypothetical protein
MADSYGGQGKQHQGTSNSGNFQEALDQAINAAQPTGGADIVFWKLGEVTGSKGGIVSASSITVTIEVTGP